MKVLGQLENASLENLSSDPASNVEGRVFRNTTDKKVKLDDGVVKRQFLVNDEHAVIGNDAAAANNIRIKRAANQLVQLLLASDASLEGVQGTLLAQISARLENYLSSGLPAAGQIGRAAYQTDTNTLALDNGSAWKDILSDVLGSAKGDLIARTASKFSRLAVGTDGQVLTADSAQTLGVKWASNSAKPIIRKTAGTYSASIGDGTYLLDCSGGPIIMNLPAAGGNNGEELTFLKADSPYSAVNIVTITGVTTLNSQNESITLQSDNSNWIETRRNIPEVWTAGTFTVSGGFGGISSQSSKMRREGDSLHCRVFMTFSSTAAAPGYISLPSSLAIDTAKQVSALTILGNWVALVGTTAYAASPYRIGPIMYNGTGITISSAGNVSSSAMSAATVNSFVGGGQSLAAEFTVPISGWNG